MVGEALTPELTVDFACAFGAWADGGPVVIGRDTRRSSPMLRAAVTAGLMSRGCEVIDMGICTTPLLSFAVRELACAGGISITGSHNDAQWNALKFLGPDGALLNAVKGEELLDIYHASPCGATPPAWLAVSAPPPDVRERYVEHLLAAVDGGAIRRRRFRLALDFCNGAAGGVAAEFLGRLGCTLVPLNAEPGGTFAHPPAPSPENMRQLSRFTREVAADLGAALNVDGDRIGFVLRDGRALSEEHTLPLAALGRLARRPGPVVVNLSTSRMTDIVAARFAQRVVRAPVGESYVVDRALEEGAVLAGEGSGGTVALPAGMTFDGLLTLGIVLEGIAGEEGGLQSLADSLPRLEMRKGAVECLPDRAYRALEYFRACYVSRQPDFTDGVRIDLQHAWLHVRVSNTEPLVRVIAEAEDAGRADRLFEEAMALARRAADSARGGVG